MHEMPYNKPGLDID